MPCDPNSNSLNPAIKPGIPTPGFPALPSVPFFKPIPNFEIPYFPEKIIEFIDSLSVKWSGGQLNPHLDDVQNTVLKAISDLFSQMSPFLSMYSFFMPVLNLITCIIDVLCALINPFKLKKALKRLFKSCLPDFLRLFPFFALIVMIISILLLILAIIQYIIQKIIALINDLLENIRLLSSVNSLGDSNAALAIARKIASMLCILENLFAVFGGIAAIIQIIETLSKLAGRKICGGRGSGCCDSDDCPDFLIDNPEGMSGSFGTLKYYREYKPATSAGTLTRPESLQFFNNQSDQVYHFADIIKPNSRGGIYWPESDTYKTDSNLNQVPYTVDMTIYGLDPAVFNPSDTGGSRNFVVKNTIVYIKPYVGIYDFNNHLNTTVNNTGTFKLLGGIVYEADGTTPYLTNDAYTSIENFIHYSSIVSDVAPVSDDAVLITNISYTLKFNFDYLFGKALITAGCDPELLPEMDLVNTANPGVRGALVDEVSTPILPDISGLSACLANALIKLRKNITEETLLEFQAETILCLETAKDQTNTALKGLMALAVDPTKSNITLTPDLQFVSRPINVNVVFNDPNGINVFAQLPVDIQPEIISLIEGRATLGDVSEFVYDGYGNFTASITSDVPGDGYFTVSYNNNVLQTISNIDDLTKTTTIAENAVPYTFVGGVGGLININANAVDNAIRRDNTDTSNTNGIE